MRGFMLSFKRLLFGFALLILNSPIDVQARMGRSAATFSKEDADKAVTFYFRALDANSGGIETIGFRFRYKFLEAGLSVLPTVVPSVAFRFQFNDGSWFTPHFAVGYPYSGPSLEFRIPKLWLFRAIIRIDQYFAFNILTRSVVPWFTIGLGVGF